MEDLKKLFEYRLQKYRQTTESILQKIPNVTEGVLQALSEDESSTLEWEDIQYDEAASLIILIGVIKLAVGEHVQLENGREIHVTDDNVETFKRIVRVGIPYDLAETGSIEDVTAFFDGKRQTNYTTLDDLVDSLDDYEDVNDLQRQAVTSILGFDVDGLSDEQIQQIINNSDEGKVH